MLQHLYPCCGLPCKGSDTCFCCVVLCGSYKSEGPATAAIGGTSNVWVRIKLCFSHLTLSFIWRRNNALGRPWEACAENATNNKTPHEQKQKWKLQTKDCCCWRTNSKRRCKYDALKRFTYDFQFYNIHIAIALAEIIKYPRIEQITRFFSFEFVFKNRQENAVRVANS